MIPKLEKQPTLRNHLMIYAILLLMQPVEIHNIYHQNGDSQIHRIRHQQLRNKNGQDGGALRDNIGAAVDYNQSTSEQTVNKSPTKNDTMTLLRKRDPDETLLKNNYSELLNPLLSGDFNKHKQLNDEFKNDNITITRPPSELYLNNLFEVVHHRSRRGTNKKRYNKTCYKKIVRLLKTPLQVYCLQRGVEWKNIDLNVVVTEWIDRFQSMCHGQLDIHITKQKGYPIVELSISSLEISLSISDNAIDMNDINPINMPTTQLITPVVGVTNAAIVDVKSEKIETINSASTFAISSEIATTMPSMSGSTLSEFRKAQDVTLGSATGSEINNNTIQLWNDEGGNKFIENQNVTNIQIETSTQSVAPPELAVTDYMHQQAGRINFAYTSQTKSKHRRATAWWLSHKGIPAKETPKEDNYCRKRHIYIDFKKIGLDFILAPSGYHAYYCAGDCPMSLPAHFNTTNHAIIQSLLHSVNQQAIPGPCCVAIALSPISMIYKNAKGVPTIGNYNDMVVEACGCR